MQNHYGRPPPAQGMQMVWQGVPVQPGTVPYPQYMLPAQVEAQGMPYRSMGHPQYHPRPPGPRAPPFPPPLHHMRTHQPFSHHQPPAHPARPENPHQGPHGPPVNSHLTHRGPSGPTEKQGATHGNHLPPQQQATHRQKPQEQKQQQPDRIYANKKDREKAKRERKEARKLAENPLPILTEDVKPRACANAEEAAELDAWVSQRKLRFPTAANLERRRKEADAMAAAGASEGGLTGSDGALFEVLQKQQRLGLLRSAGTEELFQNFARRGGHGRGRGRGGGRGRRGRGRGQEGRDRSESQAPLPTPAQPAEAGNGGIGAEVSGGAAGGASAAAGEGDIPAAAGVNSCEGMAAEQVQSERAACVAEHLASQQMPQGGVTPKEEQPQEKQVEGDGREGFHGALQLSEGTQDALSLVATGTHASSMPATGVCDGNSAARDAVATPAVKVIAMDTAGLSAGHVESNAWARCSAELRERCEDGQGLRESGTLVAVADRSLLGVAQGSGCKGSVPQEVRERGQDTGAEQPGHLQAPHAGQGAMKRGAGEQIASGWQPAGKRRKHGASGAASQVKKPCLLHRLVAADVRQDRNLLLQMFRFFTTNNFLQDIGKQPLVFPRQGATSQAHNP